MTIRHRIAHVLGWNAGRVETFWALFRHGDDKRLMVAFRCSCGELLHVNEAPTQVDPLGLSDATEGLASGDAAWFMEGLRQTVNIGRKDAKTGGQA